MTATNADHSEENLMAKLARHARSAGSEMVEKVLWLFYASRRPDVPAWAKFSIYSALAYFVLPIDAIPDLAPVLGYSDDLAVVSAALLTLMRYVDEDVKQQTRERMAEWFG